MGKQGLSGTARPIGPWEIGKAVPHMGQTQDGGKTFLQGPSVYEGQSVSAKTSNFDFLLLNVYSPDFSLPKTS